MTRLDVIGLWHAFGRRAHHAIPSGDRQPATRGYSRQLLWWITQTSPYKPPSKALSLDLQAQCIILHIHRLRQQSRFIIRRLRRQTQHQLIHSLREHFGGEGKFVRDVVADDGGPDRA